MTKTFEQWIKDNLNLDMPEGDTIPGEWFVENQLPIIVTCTCCDSTLCIVSAHIDEDGDIFCSTCNSED